MSRPLRIDIEGGWYHVTARGHNRRDIFLDRPDRQHFMELLEEMIVRHRVEVHAYVLMKNHYHLLVRTPDANLSQAIQWLNVSYSVWWNSKHQSCGSLFQGRFKAVVVEGGEWLLSLSQYIHYNPVAIKGLGLGKRERAAERKGWTVPTKKMAAKRLEALRSYEWSSYPAYAGYEKIPAWLTTRAVLGQIQGGHPGYRKATEERLLAGQEEDFWASLRWGFVLGREAFAETVRKRLKVGRESSGRRRVRRRVAWPDLVRCMEELKKEPWSAFRDRRGDWGRDVTLWAARRLGGYTLAELAREVGAVDYTAIYQGVRRLEARSKKDDKLLKIMRQYERKLASMYNVET
ncbi:MAG: transposase [Kiritimatiellae bacterium]|nr:transposase [Kiritimatiellia bacterium]